jgi:hypothetical protein
MSEKTVQYMLEGNNFAALERLNTKLPLGQKILPMLSEERWEIKSGFGENCWLPEEGPREFLEKDIATIQRNTDQITALWIHSPVMLAMMLINNVITCKQIDALQEGQPMVIHGIGFSFPGEAQPRLLDLVIAPDLSPTCDRYTFRSADATILVR